VHVIVDWCEEGHGVACDECIKAGTTKKVGMLNVDRKFPNSIYITDAEYTWRDIGDLPIYKGSTDTYFYKNVLPDGYYAGTVHVDSARRNQGIFLHNRICGIHYVPPAPEPDPSPDPNPDPSLTPTS
jgi:hypothetical protein